MITRSEFESSAAKKEVYKVNEVHDLKALEKELKECPYHILAKIASRNIEAINLLCAQGFCYSSTILHLKHDLQGVSQVACKDIKELSLDQKEALYRITDEAFSCNHNRYTDDPFLKDSCKDIHRAWILNSLNGYADYVCGYIEKDVLAGFATLHLKGESAVIGLVATDKAYRQKGIGMNIVRDLMTTAITKQKRSIIVKTQATNIPALNLYARNGFLLFDSEVTFYRLGRKVQR